jgi:hypothetical protein
MTTKLSKINTINGDVTDNLLGDYADLGNFTSSKLSALKLIIKNSNLCIKG